MVVGLSLMLPAVPTAEAARPVGDDNVVIQWIDAALEAVRNSDLDPPVVARGLAVISTCMYDAWARLRPRRSGYPTGCEPSSPPR
jgi:hypothetical protein